MSEHNEVGKQGESIALEYLIGKQYTILHTNWRYHPKELDIVARDGDELVVVEVKTRTYPFWVDPLESINHAKTKHVIRAAQAYVFRYNIELDVRFDVIVVSLNRGHHEVEHIEDAFYPSIE